MVKQPNNKGKKKPKEWNKNELQKVIRLFELLARIDKRMKNNGGKSNN